MNKFLHWFFALIAPFLASMVVFLIYQFLGWVITARSDYNAPSFLGWGARAMEWFHVYIAYYLMRIIQSAAFVAAPAIVAPNWKRTAGGVFFAFLAIAVVFGFVVNWGIGEWKFYVESASVFIGALAGIMIAWAEGKEDC